MLQILSKLKHFLRQKVVYLWQSCLCAPCTNMSSGKLCCLFCTAFIIIGFYIVALIYLPISMEYNQTKRFIETQCTVLSVKDTCKQCKTCQNEACARVDVQFFNTAQVSKSAQLLTTWIFQAGKCTTLSFLVWYRNRQ